jgi:hypothetical protein
VGLNCPEKLYLDAGNQALPRSCKSEYHATSSIVCSARSGCRRRQVTSWRYRRRPSSHRLFPKLVSLVSHRFGKRGVLEREEGFVGCHPSRSPPASSVGPLPAACLAFIISATASLSRCISVPLLVFFDFCPVQEGAWSVTVRHRVALAHRFHRGNVRRLRRGHVVACYSAPGACARGG